MASNRGWMDLETAATELGVPMNVVLESVRAGQLPAIQIGQYTRISRDALIDLASGRISQSVAGTDHTETHEHIQVEGLPVPAGSGWIEVLEPKGEFSYPWPKTGGGTWIELYERSWDGLISLHGQQVPAKVAVGTRHDRGRMSIFLNRSPVCEFVETRDGLGWASLIKPDGKKVLPIGVAPPPLYDGVRIEPYREATGMSGSGVPNGLALVLPISDYRSAVHHAAARWLGRNHLPVEPGE